MKALFITLQYLVPHHLLSRLIGWFAASELAFIKNPLIRSFIRIYRVDMDQALHSQAEDYTSFNDFFTRPLKAQARPITADASAIACPADGFISALGNIEQDRIFQAKGRDFTLQALLGGEEHLAEQFQNGKFATIYLSPRDYHRVHMPFAGTLKRMIFIPGRLFSVNQTTCDRIPNLFARNERAVCLFDTELGPMAVILVGAMIVASIETVWAGQVAPGPGGIRQYDYSSEQPTIRIDKGQEMGRFKLGSTAIVLFGPGKATWSAQLGNSDTVRMGEELGTGL